MTNDSLKRAILLNKDHLEDQNRRGVINRLSLIDQQKAIEKQIHQNNGRLEQIEIVLKLLETKETPPVPSLTPPAA